MKTGLSVIESPRGKEHFYIYNDHSYDIVEGVSLDRNLTTDLLLIIDTDNFGGVKLVTYLWGASFAKGYLCDLPEGIYPTDEQTGELRELLEGIEELISRDI